jgi:hypothetical protein
MNELIKKLPSEIVDVIRDYVCSPETMLEIFLSQYPLQQILDGITNSKVDDYVLFKKTNKISILSTLHKNYIHNENEKKILSEYFVAVTIAEPGCLPTRKEHPAILSLYQPYNLQNCHDYNVGWHYANHVIWIKNILSIKGSVSNRHLKDILASKALFVLRKHKILANIMDDYIVKNQTKINEHKLKIAERNAIKEAAKQVERQRIQVAKNKAQALKNELNEKIGLNKELEKIRTLKNKVRKMVINKTLAEKEAAKLAEKEAAKATKLAEKEAVKATKLAEKEAAKAEKATARLKQRSKE